MLKKILIIFLASLIIFISIFPIFFIFYNSFKSAQEYSQSFFSFPTGVKPFYDNLSHLYRTGYIKAILNTIITISIALFLGISFASMAGFSFAKLNFPLRKFIYWGFIGLLAIPSQVLIIPLYILYSNLNWVNNLYSLGIFYAIWSFPLGAFLMTSFYKGIPNELIDSAKIDGADNVKIFFKIFLPLGRPAIFAVAVINFFSLWNELFVAFIFNRNIDSRLITPYIALFNEQMRTGGSGFGTWPIIFTASSFSLIIPLIIYILFQNKLVEGLTVGAVKG